ncbi:MAG: outer membrane protein assembly factor BamA [Spirochaetales bacterium]|nr:outer membrane protein assembly factor BamA [Spirochaetales bacterium]
MIFRKTHTSVHTFMKKIFPFVNALLVRISLILLFFLLFVGPLASEESDWFEGKPLVDIKFVGINKASMPEIKAVVKDYIGNLFSRSIYYEIENKLWDLDFFDDIVGDIQSGDSEKMSVIIEFRIKEKPVIIDIKIVGNKLITRSEILDEVKCKIGDFENKVLVYEDEQTIKQFYIDHGFHEAKVSSRIEPNEAGDKITVYFDVDEGYKATIKEFYFSGNNFASASTLKGKLASKKQEFFNHGYFVESNLELDKENIVTYYNKSGYIDAKVEKTEKSVEYDEEKGRSYMTITYYIVEGEQYTFGGVVFEGNRIFSNEVLLSKISQKSGKVFNKVKWDSDFQAIITLYADGGYIHNSIFDKQERDEINKVVSYHITVVERDRAHIENIILVGNVKTKDYVILRELPFGVGDIFSAEKIRQGMYNLFNLQYFTDIRPQPVQGSSEGLMDLIITVEESQWADLRLGIAFSGGNFPISGQFGWSDKNFFGTGRTIGFDVELSTAKQGFSFTYNDSYLFGKGWGGGLTLSYFHNFFDNAYQDIVPPIFDDEDIPDPYTSEDDYEDAVNRGIDQNRAILMHYDNHEIELAGSTNLYTLTLLGKFGISTQLATNATYVWYDPEKYRHYNKTVRDNLLTWNLINTWGTTFYWDKRDIYYNPEKGFILSEYVGLSGGFLFGARDYIKLKTRAEAFVTLFKIPLSETYDFQTVLAVHAGLGFLFPQFNGKLFATERERFYIDGMSIARGWDPVWDGEVLFDFSLELRHPIIKTMLWWSWFFDAAALYPERDNIPLDDITTYYFSFGGGLRLTIPGLPLRLYLAQRFRVEDGAVVWEEGEIPLFKPLSLRFVVSVTPPGGF